MPALIRLLKLRIFVSEQPHLTAEAAENAENKPVVISSVDYVSIVEDLSSAEGSLK
jgi:hypothetical protein